MSDMMLLALTPFAGMLLGAMYFGGLWWTVRKGLASPRPAQWFIFSLLLRLGLTLSGFYFVAGNDWKKMLACLLGFIVARIIVIRLTEMPIAKGAGDAP
jgi:F1F0 ATPase subunit 2